MTITSEQWRKIQRAIQDDGLTELLSDMLDEAYEEGRRDGYEMGKEEVSNSRCIGVTRASR